MESLQKHVSSTKPSLAVDNGAILLLLCICKYTQSPVKPRLAIVKNQKHDVFTEYSLLKVDIFLTATFNRT